MEPGSEIACSAHLAGGRDIYSRRGVSVRGRVGRRGTPENQHVREKIRQTLQQLRDAGLIEFLDDRGTYRRIAGQPSGSRAFGELPGFQAGQGFPSRYGGWLWSGLHPPLQAGISGAAEEGADSIVVSGGYEDDKDFGDLIIYTGQGGRYPASGAQIADQHFTGQNQGLRRNWG